MIQKEQRLQRYYKTGQYKNFYKLKERRSTITGHVHVTFTNGIQEIIASDIHTEAALKNIFSQIDNLDSKHEKKQSLSYQT